METSCLVLIISGNGGSIPSFQSGHSMGRGSSGIGTSSHLYRMFDNDFSQGNTGQPGYVPLNDCILVQAAFDLKRPTLGFKVCPGQCYRSSGHYVRR